MRCIAIYPILKDGVIFGTFYYEGENPDTTRYYAENPDGKEIEISRRLMDALLKADGTKPLDLPDGGRKILPSLKRDKLVQTSRFVRGEGIFNRIIIFLIGSKIKKYRSICRIINALLPVISILLFVLSINMLSSKKVVIGYDFNWFLYFALIFVSITLHETGHMIAGLAYGYTFSDAGILLLGIIPCGGYVAAKEKEDPKRIEGVQFSLAGIQMNLLTAAICIFLACYCPPLSCTLIGVANINVAWAGINLLPSKGLDGESALSNLFGVDSISDFAKKCLSDRFCRKVLLHSGLPGMGCFLVFLLTLVSRVILWAIIVFDLGMVILDIFVF